MSPRFTSENNPKKRSPLHPAGSEGALDGPASTPEEIATAEKERAELVRMIVAPAEPASGQAPAGAAAFQRPSTIGTEPLIPAQPVDVEHLTKARQSRLEAIAQAGRKVRELEAQLEEQQRNAEELAKQIKADRLAIVQEKERHEQEAIRHQHEINRSDALAAAAALEQSTADRQVLILDEKAAWRNKLQATLKPLIEMARQELAELQSIQGGSSEIFGRAAAYKVDLSLSQIGDGGVLYHTLDAACESCHKTNEETKASIAQCQRALGAAKRIVEYLPPDTADGRLMISRVTTDLSYCKDHAYAARTRTEGAIEQFTSASKQAAPYLKTAKPVRQDVVVSLSGEDRESMQRRMLSKSLPPQQTHAAGMNLDPLA